MERVGSFELVELLGEGAVGAVYRARLIGSGDEVALKIIHARWGGEPKIVLRFNREAEIIRQLRHRNVPLLVGFGRLEDGRPYIASELAQGETLDRIIARGPLDSSRTVRLMLDVASALAQAHGLGIVHRDLKPPNLMVDASSSPWVTRVLDFGIAKIEGSPITSTLKICGSPAYMSPEQADAAEVDGRSDLYSLGTIAYQCLSQRLPFQADSIVALMIARQRDKPRHLLELGIPVAIDPQLASVVMWLLERNVGSRPAGAGALMEILEGIASRLDAPSVARDDGALADTAAGEDMIATVVDGEATIDERTIEGRPKLPRRRRAVRPPRLTIARRLPQKRWWPWALLVLAVGTAFAAMATRLGRDPDPAPIPITVESPEVVDPAPPRPRLHIDSRPRGATISVRGDMLGQTPLDIEAPVGIDTATITLSLLGYRRWRGLAEKAYDFVLEVDLVPGIDVEAFIREPGVRWLAVELFAPWCAPCVKERPD